MLCVIIISVVGCIIVGNIGYHDIQLDDGTLYGKFKGNDKDLVLLIVAGSGPTDMNGNSSLTQGRNDSFIQLAKDLSHRGITTFRYDKRTAGRSVDTFDNKDMDFDYFIDDCRDAIKYLKEQGYKKIVIIGHSQGSLVGMMAAIQEPVDGFISVAGSGFTIDTILENQLLPHYDEKSKEIKAIHSLREGTIDTSFDEDHALFSVTNQEFLLTWMKYNPAEEIKKLNIPILLIQGDMDTQVNVDDLKSLKAANSQDESILIKGMNHVLKKVSSEEENVVTYTDPSYQLHSELVPTIVKFINTLK
jgi:hypothetical protein